MRSSRTLFLLLSIIFIIGCSSQTIEQGKSTRFGIIADLHTNGNYDALGKILDNFDEKEVDAIIIAGDIALNEMHRSGTKDSVNDDEEIYMVLKRTLMRGHPTFVIPGNHETKAAWEKAMARLKDDDFLGNVKNYDKLFDMTKIRTYDKLDIDLLSLPGCVDSNVTPADGFVADADEIYVLSQRLDDDILLIGHCPPIGFGEYGIDMLDSGKHTGSERLLDVMQESGIRFGVFGHIHEAFGTVDINGTKAVPKKFAESLTLNPGPGQNGYFGILYYDKAGSRARYEQFITR